MTEDPGDQPIQQTLEDQGPDALAARVLELEGRLKTLAEAQSRINTATTNQALRDSEERFRLLAENSTDMISRHNATGHYLYVSPACRTILGYEPHDILGKGAYDFIHPEDWSVVRNAHDKQLSDTAANATTYRMLHRNGQAVWVESTTRCLLDDQSQIIEIHAATRDVTDRIIAQQKLTESEEHYRSLIECASDIIMRLDAEKRIIFTNQALGPEIRQKLQNLYFVNWVAPEYRELANEALDQAFDHNQPSSAELLITHTDNVTQSWYACRFAPIQTHGRTVAATVIATNITQRKETEKALLLVRSAIENVQDAVIITTAELEAPGPQIVYVNKAFEAMTGYTKEEILGLTPRILQGPRTSRDVLDRLKQFLREHKLFHGETINYRKDGSDYYLEWDISPVFDEQGQVINYVSVQRDLTQQRKQEEIVRRNQNELAHVGRLSTMGEMASGLAHELNQPLTAITNYTRGCLRKLQATPHPDPKIAEAIEAAALQADRAGQIIRRLRQFIRKRVPQHSPVSLNDVVRDSVALMSGDLRQQQVEILLDLDDNLPLVKADHVQMEQVAINLFRNAIEAMTPLHGPQRRIRVVTRQADEGVRLSVRDNGPGMDQATRDHIFDPFFTTKTRGLGMGLPICQSIVEAHSGRLWVNMNHEPVDEALQSEGGALFHLWLPQVNEEDVIDTPEPADLQEFI